MIRSQKEKDERIWKLLKERHSYREIYKIKHRSLNEVSRINKIQIGESNESNIQIKNKSICSRAFDCFIKKKPLPQIVKDLDIELEKVKNFL